MRRLFVLLLVFLIPFQFMDESLDDLLVPSSMPVQVSVSLQSLVHDLDTAGVDTVMADASDEDRSSQIPHADLADSMPGSAPALLLLAGMHPLLHEAMHVWPLIVFPVVHPPRA